MDKKVESAAILVCLILLYNLPSNSFAQAIELTWSANPENDIMYYSIYRGSTSAEETEIAQVPVTDTTYFDSDIVVGETYYYRITAVDSADNVSEFSDLIEVVTSFPTTVGSNSAGIPEKFELSQNYPNPFNPETRFNYFVAENANVTLSIYDLLGRKVKTLVAENKEAGIYSTTWDGRNEFGNKVASGLYFASMVAGGFRQIKKLVLQK